MAAGLVAKLSESLAIMATLQFLFPISHVKQEQWHIKRLYLFFHDILPVLLCRTDWGTDCHVQLQCCLGLLTGISGHNLGNLCTESAELVLQGGGTVQCRHARLLKPFHPFTLTTEVGHRGIPVEHEEWCGPPFMLQRTRVTPENRQVGDPIAFNTKGCLSPTETTL